MIDYTTVIRDHETEIKHNDVLISHLRDSIICMERSIRILKIENNGHNARICALDRLMEEE